MKDIPTFGKRVLGRLIRRSVRRGALQDFRDQFLYIAENGKPIQAQAWLWLQILVLLPAFVSDSIKWRIEMFRNYLKIALRNIIKHKGYSVINITGLAIGLACCMLITLFVRDELSFDQFNEKHQRIFRLERKGVFQNQAYHLPVTPHPLGPTLKNDFPEIEQTVRIRGYELMIKNPANQYLEEDIYFVDDTVFDTFTFPLIAGNPAQALEDPNSIVLTRRMSERYFAEANPMGKTLAVKWVDEQLTFKVTGIMADIPANSHLKTDCFVSYSTLDQQLGKEAMGNWFNNSSYTYILLKEGAELDALTTAFPRFIETHMGRMARMYLGKDLDINTLMRFVLRPVTDIHLRSNLEFEMQPGGSINSVYIFSIIAFIVLLIACINFMNLSTARSANRAREVGLRKTVGAFRSLLIKQFIGESILMVFIAGIFAVLLVQLVLPFYNAFTLKSLSNHFISQPGSMLLFAAVILLVGILSGSYPAFFLSSFEPIKVLRGFKRGGKASRSDWMRKGLVVFQFAISVMLIISTLVVMKQLNYLRNKALGFNRERIVVIQARDVSSLADIESVKTELGRHANVVNVSTSGMIPGNRMFPDQGYLREGANRDELKPMVFFYIDHDYLPLMGMEIVAGRNFSRQFGSDLKDGIILNESAVEKFGWDDAEAALGQGVLIPEGPNKFTRKEVVGVVKDFNYKSLHQKIEPLTMLMDPKYVSYVLVKIRDTDITDTMAFLEKRWAELSPNHTFESFFLDKNFDLLYRAEERMQTIFRFFTLMAIFVSCLGLFGLASYTAEQRTKEVGIRKVLGATIPNITVNLSKEFVLWVLLSNVVAWPLAYLAMSRWLRDFAYRVDIGLSTFILAGLLGLVIALLTVAFQIIKTAFANPVDTLKYE